MTPTGNSPPASYKIAGASTQAQRAYDLVALAMKTALTPLGNADRTRVLLQIAADAEHTLEVLETETTA